jgi:hypothetical protein
VRLLLYDVRVIALDKAIFVQAIMPDLYLVHRRPPLMPRDRIARATQ